ncbi:hypothetical protein K0M31_008554 [Melipona bicolor]|uniref:Uncharacterized protein n=1 Tax=Melipona bicolor TaxID=60889 RepID=A0AA40FRX6_9HYME|nr:hypothetical protein K0M31_008554 [Melipona bicolor]
MNTRRDYSDAGGFLAANYDKQQQQQQNEYITSNNEILGSSHSIEIPQTPRLLNQTSHENYMTAETAHIHNSLPGFDSKKLKFQADKIPSSLLLDGERRNKNISEQNNSGIYSVTTTRAPREEKGREPAAGTLSGRRGCNGEHESLVLQFDLDDIGQLVRLQPHKREDSRIVGSFDRGARRNTFRGYRQTWTVRTKSQQADLRLRLESVRLPHQLHPELGEPEFFEAS